MTAPETERRKLRMTRPVTPERDSDDPFLAGVYDDDAEDAEAEAREREEFLIQEQWDELRPAPAAAPPSHDDKAIAAVADASLALGLLEAALRQETAHNRQRAILRAMAEAEASALAATASEPVDALRVYLLLEGLAGPATEGERRALQVGAALTRWIDRRAGRGRGGRGASQPLRAAECLFGPTEWAALSEDRRTALSAWAAGAAACSGWPLKAHRAALTWPSGEVAYGGRSAEQLLVAMMSSAAAMEALAFLPLCGGGARRVSLRRTLSADAGPSPLARRAQAAALHHLQTLRRRRDWKRRAEDAFPKGRGRPSVARDWLVNTLSARGFAYSTEKQARAIGTTLTSMNRMSAMMHAAGVIEVADRIGMMNVWSIR